MAIYLVSDSWYESYSPTIVEGPEQADWEAFCRTLMDKAVLNAIKHKGRSPALYEPCEDGSCSWIGMDEYKDELVELLKEKGYKVLKPSEFNLWGSNITNETDEIEKYGVSSEVASKVVKYNEDMRDELDKEFEKRRELDDDE